MKFLVRYVLVTMLTLSSALPALAVNVRLTEISVSNAFFYLPLGRSKTTMAFFTITNNSNKDITIIGVTSPVAKWLNLMPKTNLLVPAHETVALKGSGRYLQINELKTQLHTGDELQLLITLSNGKKLHVIAVAKSAYDQPHGH